MTSAPTQAGTCSTSHRTARLPPAEKWRPWLHGPHCPCRTVTSAQWKPRSGRSARCCRRCARPSKPSRLPLRLMEERSWSQWSLGAEGDNRQRINPGVSAAPERGPPRARSSDARPQSSECRAASAQPAVCRRNGVSCAWVGLRCSPRLATCRITWIGSFAHRRQSCGNR